MTKNYDLIQILGTIEESYPKFAYDSIIEFSDPKINSHDILKEVYGNDYDERTGTVRF